MQLQSSSVKYGGMDKVCGFNAICITGAATGCIKSVSTLDLSLVLMSEKKLSHESIAV